jgi:hypothetical protein
MTMPRPSGWPSTRHAKECALFVYETDHEKPDEHGGEYFAVHLSSLTGDNATDYPARCIFEDQVGLPGDKSDERSGVDLTCPHLGKAPFDTISVMREADDVLRFIWASETWTGNDENCTLLSDWEHVESLSVSGKSLFDARDAGRLLMK